MVNLKKYVAGRAPPVKTLHVANPGDMEKLSFPEILALQAAPPGYKCIVRLEQTTNAKRTLVGAHHPVHSETVGYDDEGNPVFRDADEIASMFKSSLSDVIGDPGWTEDSARPNDVNPKDWFVKFGPRLGRIYSLSTPDLERELPDEWKNLALLGHKGIHLNMGALIDPKNENGPSAPGRSVDLDDQSWLLSRLSSIYRNGLPSDPEQMLAHYTVRDVKTSKRDVKTSKLNYHCR